MTRAQIEARLIRIRRTQALDLKAAADLEARAKRKRDNAALLQAEASRLERKLVKAKT